MLFEKGMMTMKAKKKYYLAYGSNLNVPQMKMRCPTARPVGTGFIEGYELLFKGSKTGSYLTIEPNENAKVPVAVWEVTDTDERSLDRYEGYPTFYYKAERKISFKSLERGNRRTVNAFVYIMHEDRPIGVPTTHYMKTCLEGYNSFGMDENILWKAYEKCREKVAI